MVLFHLFVQITHKSTQAAVSDKYVLLLPDLQINIKRNVTIAP